MSRSDAFGEIKLTELLGAFKAARASGSATDLRDFLPPPDHALYRQARREILRADLEFAWQEGTRRLLLDYVGVFADLLDDRATIQELALAEYRLRLQAGENPPPSEYEWQYGVTTSAWPGLALDGASAPASEPRTEIAEAPDQILTRIVAPTPKVAPNGAEAAPDVEAAHWFNEAMNALPAVGTQFLNFRLIAELGRGGFGRVYLARQGDLAHRLVALKITVDLPGEEQKLAQMQHTNVVPIYSFHQAGDLHAVCMPYFGATTLADIVHGLRHNAKLPDSGRGLVSIVRARRSTVLEKAAAAEPHRPSGVAGPSVREPQRHGLGDLAAEEDVPVTLTMLEEATYVEAVLWLAERLTEGLSHAHEHGILHRDLKPANILLTDDGQPMLLDFNLSSDTKPDAALNDRRVGGTLPYMAPEHLASLAGGPAALDERSDVYALGIILYELLTGRLPFAAPSRPTNAAVPAMIAERMQPPPRLRRWNPAVSFAVESLVRHCLEADPRRRYQSARQLREDLKRQRQHRALRYAAEPSVRERLQKWVRRHPRLASPATLGAVTAFVLALTLAPTSWQTWNEWEMQNAARDEALLKAAAGEQRRAEALQKYGNFRGSLASSSRAVMESVNAVQVLPRFMKAWACEEARLQANAAKCRRSLEHYEVLQRPAWQDRPTVQNLPAHEREQLRREVFELLFVLAQAELVRAERLREQDRLHDLAQGGLVVPGAGLGVWGAWRAVMQVPVISALDLNERARQCCADAAIPRAVLIQQADLLHLLGKDAEANSVLKRADETPVGAGAEDAYWTASALAAKGKFKEALPLLSQAVGAAPDHYGAWLLRGLCLNPEEFSYVTLKNDQPDRQKALECFTTCVVMRPEGLWAYYNRGMVSHYLNLTSNALADLDRVLQKEVVDKQPAFGSAYVQRAAVCMDMGKPKEAEDALTAAIALEPDVPEYFYLRARIREKLEKHDDARDDDQQVLDGTPTGADGWTYRGMVRAERGKVRAAKDPKGASAIFGRALEDFDRALQLSPQDPATLFEKGRLLAEDLNRKEAAVNVLNKALAAKPDYVKARITRGLAYAALGERTLALRDADALVAGEPTPQMHYQAARIYALTSRQNPKDAPVALALLASALRRGHGVYMYRQEPDFAPLHKLREFKGFGPALESFGWPPP